MAHLYDSPLSLMNDWRHSRAASSPASCLLDRLRFSISISSSFGVSVGLSIPFICLGADLSSIFILESLCFFHTSLSFIPLMTPLDGNSVQ